MVNSSYDNHKLSFCVLLFCLIFSSISLTATAQPQNFPLNRDIVNGYENALNNKNVVFHTAVKPYLNEELKIISDSVTSFSHYKPKFKNFFSDTISVGHPQKKASFTIGISPFLLQWGYDLSASDKVFEAGGSLRTTMYFGKKLFFTANTFYANAGFVSYIDTFIKTTNVVPGMGDAYASKRGFSYQNYA